ncbi:YtnP family quorum-quenching lactonase [Salipaludibacillus sp. HK11]|uniref:YtnP family quorum-quenching lactonase n=1 Tax=Salipaludibacillus sp. HK11 TaxID=3394320 RepID=UPI0039FCA711
MEQWQLAEDVTLTWLNGGVTHMDGGAMFGVVPKPLWSKKYPSNDQNQIELRTDPILIQVEGRNILVDGGIGNGKFSDKAKRNFGITEESKVDQSLDQLGLSREDIDTILMTHLHFDHASGLTMWEEDDLRPTFPNAIIWVQEIEWNDIRKPNIRSKNTYFKDNWQAIKDQVRTFNNEVEVVRGLKLIHTGGHSAGHCILHLQRGGQEVWHMADIMPTHAHQNVLWVLAYDDYPMDSIAKKQEFIIPAMTKEVWFSFYHDYNYRMIKWDASGNEVLDYVERDSSNEY